jgi:hypothetical protein
MLNNHKIVLDYFCEIHQLIEPVADERFYDLAQHEVVPNAIYVIGRNNFNLHKSRIQNWINTGVIKGFVLCNPAEGSEPMMWMYNRDREFHVSNRTCFISGGKLPPEVPHMLFEYFGTVVHDYNENLQAIEHYGKNYTVDRPYKFLFFNGRPRPHRIYLLKRLQMSGLLDQALWTNLGDGHAYATNLTLIQNGVNTINKPFPVHFLPPEYEVERYRHATQSVPIKLDVQGPFGPDLYAKQHLFGKDWGEIYIEPRAYEHTYFSLITETVFEYAHSFRTEKLWKPIAMGHPWIAVSNTGFYRDMHNLGFQTFGHVIDESFDQIENNQDRIERITQVVEDLCKQDLASFLAECYNVCKYNQQHLKEMRVKVRAEFLQRFEQYINERF